MIVAGEACGPDVVAPHFDARPASKLSNEYGPTEATVWATVSHLDGATPGVPIGRPIPGAWTAIVDHRGELCPGGVVGELLIGGETVTGGYDGIESDRFTGTSALGTGRTFLTGDRAACADGQLYFHGRVDDQLNAGGLRIEPTEIEVALQRVDGVDEAVVVARDLRALDELALDVPTPTDSPRRCDAPPTQSDPRAALGRALADDAHRSLVAHLEGDPATIDREALAAHLDATLPPTAVPRVIQIHERLPRSPNGKLDRAAIASLPVATPEHRSPVGSWNRTPNWTGWSGSSGRSSSATTSGPTTTSSEPVASRCSHWSCSCGSSRSTSNVRAVSVLFEARTPRALVAALGLGGSDEDDRRARAPARRR